MDSYCINARHISNTRLRNREIDGLLSVILIAWHYKTKEMTPQIGSLAIDARCLHWIALLNQNLATKRWQLTNAEHNENFLKFEFRHRSTTKERKKPTRTRWWGGSLILLLIGPSPGAFVPFFRQKQNEQKICILRRVAAWHSVCSRSFFWNEQTI